MGFWRRKRHVEEPPEREPGVSDLAWLSKLLDQLADDIAADKSAGPIDAYWSREVRKYAAQVGAGQQAGLYGFLRLFSNDPRNTIHEQPFARGRRFDETIGLAVDLQQRLAAEDRRRAEAERGLVLRPWTAGSTGKAVVYNDGTVITTDDAAPGKPEFADIYAASGQHGNNQAAIMAIGPDGACDVFRIHRDERWLAAQLQAHDPRLHLGPPPPPV